MPRKPALRWPVSNVRRAALRAATVSLSRMDARSIRIGPLDAAVDGQGNVALVAPAPPGSTLLGVELPRR